MTEKPALKNTSIDGMIPRQNRNIIGDFKKARPLESRSVDSSFSGSGKDRLTTDVTDEQLESMTFSEDTQVAEDKSKKKLSRKERKALKANKPPRRRWSIKKIVKRAVVVIALILITTGIFLGVKIYLASQKIIDRAGDGALALRTDLDPSELSGEGDGRVNILLVGIGGEGHEGPNLSDTIIVASIDPFAKEVALLSIPRDLYVDIPGAWSSRINAAHAIGEEQGFEEVGYPSGGPGLLQKTLELTLDIPIHYYVRVDFAGFEKAVDAVGGVVLDVEERLYDPTYIIGGAVLDIPAGEQYFDGKRALYYARSRKSSARGDFARADRQRELIVALKDKVLSLGTFANPIKIAGLIDAVGDHARMSLSISELLRLYEIVNEISADQIVSVGLDNGVDGYLASQNIGGAAVLVPASGDFTEIQEFVRSIFIDGFIKSEAATVAVYNGTDVPGLASEKAAELSSYGYDVVIIDSLKEANFTKSSLFDLTSDNQYTRRYLEQRFGLSVGGTSELPEELDPGVDFVIIIGTDAED